MNSKNILFLDCFKVDGKTIKNWSLRLVRG